jgi:hypothetical protein
MRKQDFLIQLIQSLNDAERKHFILTGKLYTGNRQYIQLFELLEQQKEYSTEDLCKQLNLNTNQLAVTKHYLSEALLRCLRNFEEIESDTPEDHLVEMGKANAQLLVDRGLLAHALDVTTKTLADARKFEMLETICQLLSIQIVCLRNLERFEEMEKAYDEREKMTAVLHEFRELLLLESRVAAAERNRAQLVDLKNLLKHSLLKKKVADLLSLKSRIMWFQTRFTCYILLGDHAAALRIAGEQYQLYQKEPAMKWVNPFAWANSYSILANAELEAGNAAQAFELVLQMERSSAMQYLQKNTAAYLKGHIYTFKTELLFKLSRFRELVALVEDADKQVTSNRPIYEQFLSLFYYGLAQLHLKKGAEALINLNELLQLGNEHRMDLQNYVRPAIILCHLDLENYATVPYLVKSTRSWIKRTKNATPEVELFLSLAYSLANAPDTQRRERWLKIEEAINENKLPGLEKELHLKRWLQQKLVRTN